MSKGNDFLAEAERLRELEPPRLSLTYIQGILLLHERLVFNALQTVLC